MDSFVKKQLLKASLIFFVFAALSSVFGGWHKAYATYSVSINNYGEYFLHGATITWTAITDDPSGVTWSVTPSAGTIDPNTGFFTASSIDGTYTLTATSVSDSEISSSLTIYVGPPITLKINSGQTLFNSGDSTTFTVTTNDPIGVGWDINGVSGDSDAGDLDPDTGAFTAGKGKTGGAYTLTASSNSSDTTDSEQIYIKPDGGITVEIDTSTTTVATSSVTTFLVTTNDPTGVTWSVTTGAGTINPSTGQFTAGTNSGNYVIYATSKLDSSIVDSLVITIGILVENPAISVTVSAATTTIQSGQTDQFTANVTGSSMGVIWGINTGFVCAFSCPPDLGHIDQNGLYTASTYSSIYHIVATSVEDPTKSGSLDVRVVTGQIFVPPALGGPNYQSYFKHSGSGSSLNNPPPVPSSTSTPEVSLSLFPPTTTVFGGDSKYFTATVYDTTNTSVIWSVSKGAGSVTSAGLYTATTVPGTYTLTATSAADSTKFATADIIVVSADLKPVPSAPPITPPVTPPIVTPAAPTGGSQTVSKPASSHSDFVQNVSTSTTSTTPVVAQTGSNTSSSPVSLTTVGQAVSQATQQTIVTAGRFASDAAIAIKSPNGSTVVNSVTTVGAVSGISTWTISSLLASPVFASPVAASEVLFVPLRLWGLALSVLGIRKRRRPWGTVYDSVTKMPIDPAIVTLYDQAGKKVQTSITDLDGRFGFIVPKGAYHLKVERTNYSFPSRKLAHRQNDELYSDLYFGETINVAEDGSVIYKNIPLDPQKFDWNEFTKNKFGIMQFHSAKERLGAKIGDIIFWCGFAVGIVSVFVIPQAYSISILALYAVLIVLRYSSTEHKAFGTIIDSSNHPLSFATISIFSKDLNRELFKKVADQYGRYYALVPKGEYEIKVSRKNPDESYTEVYSKEVDAKNGVINSAIKI